MNTTVETKCSKCGRPIERTEYFVGKIKFTCSLCKRDLKQEYDQKRYEFISKLLKKYRK